MRQLVHLFTSAAILLHATVGCCAHEEHRIASDVCGHHNHKIDSNHEVGGDDCHDACHAKSEHSPLLLETECAGLLEAECTGDNPSHPHTPPTCTHVRCQWPAPEIRDSGELLLLSFSVALTHYLDSPFVSLFSLGKSTWTLSLVYSPHALPVRSHLANCVFLI